MEKRLFAMVVACCALFAHAGEIQDRAAIAAEFKTAFDRGMLYSLDERYSRALSGKERLASGVFVAARMVRGSFPVASAETIQRMGADGYYEPIEMKLRSWMAKSPQSVFAAITLSRAYYEHGWSYRGGGPANSVSEENFAKFKSYMKLAQETLLARAELGKADPNWHWQMLAVGQVYGWSTQQYFAFAQAAIDAFPDNYDIYLTVSDRLLPQWGGSLEELAAFSEYAVERTKATEGRSMYARIFRSTYSGLGAAERLKRGELDWPKIREGFDDIVKRYPDPWNLNFFARAACDAGDKATTQRILGLIGDNVAAQVWGSRSAYLRCKNLAAE